MDNKRVGIFVETSLASGREMVSGISRFARERNDWSVFFHTGPLGAMIPSFLNNWSGDGIIARIANFDLFQRVAALGIPVVDVLGNVTESPFPLVRSDDLAIARMVGEHFLSRGYRHLAFFGLEKESWSIARREGLAALASEQHDTSFHALEIQHKERESEAWSRYFSRISQWIEALPKPVGLMVASDQFGPDLIEACHHLGLAVPDQVSLVGVDNDSPFCEICRPRLSSVEPNHERVGYEAARLLDRLMQSAGSTTSEVQEIQPRMLHVRQSSDATALEDPILVRALRFIRANGCLSIGVDDIARESGVSRSVLQRRFRSVLKKTVLETVLAVRLDRAKEMLATTDLPLPDVADRSGFKHQEYLGYVFKKHLDTTPGKYRARMKGERR